ncbi:MAG: GxxExxY protein [Verrucomicrobiota bacterium]
MSSQIIGAAIEVQTELGGPGLLESVYEESLCFELKKRSLEYKRQVSLPINYKGHHLSKPLIIDLIVEDKIIVENKAISENHSVFENQLLTYLRLSKLTLGLVINFGIYPLKNGIRRVVNQLNEPPSLSASALK